MPGSPRPAKSSVFDAVDFFACLFLRRRPAFWCLFLRLTELAAVFEAMAGSFVETGVSSSTVCYVAIPGGRP